MTKKIYGRVDRASATEAVDMGSIPGRVKPFRAYSVVNSFTITQKLLLARNADLTIPVRPKYGLFRVLVL